MAHQHWTLPTWAPLPDLPIDDSTRAAQFDPSKGQTREISVDNDQTVTVRDRVTKAELLRVTAHNRSDYPHLSPDESLLFITTADGEGQNNRLEVWNIASRKKRYDWSTGKARITSFAVTPSNGLLVGGGDRFDLYCWDLKTGKELSRPSNKADLHWPRLVLSPDARQVAVVHDGGVEIFELPSGRKRNAIAVAGSPSGAAFSNDGQLFATGDGACPRILDLRTGKELNAPSGHSRSIADLACSRDGNRLTTLDSGPFGYEGHDAISWDLVQRRPLCRIHLRDPSPTLTMSADGWFGIAERRTNVPKVWDVEHDITLPRDAPQKPLILAAAGSRNGQLFGANADGALTGARIWRGHVGEVLALAASADGSVVASVGTDSAIRLWKATSPDEVLKISLFDPPRGCLALSEDASRVAATVGRQLVIWKSPGGQRIASVDCSRDEPTVLRFAPDGKVIAVGTAGGRLCLYDVEMGAPVRQQQAHQGSVAALEFAPDSALYSGGRDGAVLAWNPETLEKVGAIGKKLGPILSLVWVAEGKHLAASDDQGSVVLCDATTRKLLKDFHSFNPTVLLCVEPLSAPTRNLPAGAPAIPDESPFWLCMVDANGNFESRNLGTYQRGGASGILAMFRRDNPSVAISPDARFPPGFRYSTAPSLPMADC